MHYSLADMISDLAANSFEAMAEVVILDIFEYEDSIEIYIADNGQGMSLEELNKCLDVDFTKDKHLRPIGLGLAFMKQMVQTAGGIFKIDSEVGMGTSIFVKFNKNNLDTPPKGDFVNMLVAMFNSAGEYEIRVNFHKDNQIKSISKKEVIASLGELNTVLSLKIFKDYLLKNNF